MNEQAVQTLNENGLRMGMLTGMPISELGIEDSMVIPNKWLITSFRYDDGNAACIPTLLDNTLCSSKAAIIEHLKPSLRDSLDYLKSAFPEHSDTLIEGLLKRLTEILMAGQVNTHFEVTLPERKMPILSFYVEKIFEVPFKDYGIFDKNAIFAFNVVNEAGKEIHFIYINPKRQVGFFQQFYLGLYCLNEISGQGFLKEVTAERAFSDIQNKLDFARDTIISMRKKEAEQTEGTVQFTDYEYNCMLFVIETVKAMLVEDQEW